MSVCMSEVMSAEKQSESPEADSSRQKGRKGSSPVARRNIFGARDNSSKPAVSPKPERAVSRPTQPPSRPAQPPSIPAQPPSIPAQPPSRPAQPPSRPAQPPSKKPVASLPQTASKPERPLSKPGGSPKPAVSSKPVLTSSSRSIENSSKIAGSPAKSALVHSRSEERAFKPAASPSKLALTASKSVGIPLKPAAPPSTSGGKPTKSLEGSLKPTAAGALGRPSRPPPPPPSSPSSPSPTLETDVGSSVDPVRTRTSESQRPTVNGLAASCSGSKVTNGQVAKQGAKEEPGSKTGSKTGGEMEATMSVEVKRNGSKDTMELSAAGIKTSLRKHLAYLTGGMEDDVHPLVTIPEAGLKILDSPDAFNHLKTTLEYFKTLISAENLAAGTSFLIDARNTKTHANAKLLLERLSTEAHILPLHMVYIYMKPSFFNRTKTVNTPEMTSKLNLGYFYDQECLLEQLDANNVSTEMGGALSYSHEAWIRNRMQFEKMVKLHKRAMEKLPPVMEAMNTFDVPKTVKDAETLLQRDIDEKETMVNIIAEAEVSVDRFMTELKEQNPETTLQISPPMNLKDYIIMMSLLNNMLVELQTKQKEFDQFWSLHKARVDHMMRMCHFHRTSEKLKMLMQGHIQDLDTGSGVTVIGETLEAALELGEKHEAFVTKCKQTLDEHMSKVKEDANGLIHPTFDPQEQEQNMHSATKKAIETAKQELQRLTKTYQELMTTCQQKRDLFIVSVRFHMTIRKCQQWNQEVLEFLAAQPMEEPTHQVAASIMSHIDVFLEEIVPTQMNLLNELAAALPGKVFKKQAQKAVAKYEQTRELLENRKTSLLKIVATSLPPPPRPPGMKEPKANPLVSRVSMPPGPRLSGGADQVDSDQTSEAARAKARQFVYEELVATEQDYIKDLKTIVDGYYDEMDPDSVSIPLRLRGKRDVVFSNLLEIYKFHDTVFCHALTAYAECPEKVGECFMKFITEFQMYSTYCKNRTNSETIINESTESQAFFKGIQLKLGLVLPFNSYLIKPIQRITKYQLLLKDMMKQSMDLKKAHSDLQSALDRMLKLLKNLNDSLHVIGLKGFPGALAEQGRLLVHDAFHVWESAGRTRDIFSRGRERHVFLFEKVIILSKKIEVTVQRRNKKTDTYIYKQHLQVAEICMRETMDALQFQLSMQGQNKAIKFQALSREVRDMWTSEIRRLLQAQFTLMKDIVIKSGTLDRRAYRGKAKPSTVTRDTRLFGDSMKIRERPDSDTAALPQKKSIAERFKFIGKRKSEPRLKRSSVPSDVTASLPVSVSRSTHLKTTKSQENLMMASIREGMRTPDSEGAITSDSDDEFTFYSYSDDEGEDGLESAAAVDHYESLAPGAPRYYTAMSDYNPGSDENGVSLSEKQEVEVLGINKYGWWWVRATNCVNNEVEEGWVPASYLEVSRNQPVP